MEKLKSFNDTILQEKYVFLKQKMDKNGGYMKVLENIFDLADGNHNGIIESFELLNLVTFYFAEQGFRPGDHFLKNLIADYEPGGKYDRDGKFGLNMDEFIDFVDRVNSTIIAPAYEREITSRSASIGMDNYLRSLYDKQLQVKFSELNTKLHGGKFRRGYLRFLQDIFDRADRNNNKVIESTELLDLVTYYFDEQGFQPGEVLLRILIADYEPGGRYDNDGRMGMNMSEFVAFVDRVNTTILSPAFENEIATRRSWDREFVDLFTEDVEENICGYNHK